jgi:hypothetical protein
MSDTLSVQVARIETHLKNELGTTAEPGSLRKEINDLTSEFRALRKVIVGNGLPGVISRLDRVEQNEKRRKLILSAACVSVVGLIVKAIWEIIRKGV